MNRSLEQFRAVVMASPSLQSELMAVDDPNVFAALGVRRAAEYGIVLDSDAMRVPEDPAGIARFLPRPPDGEACPPAGWLPVSMTAGADGPVLDWYCFKGIATDTPFFEDAIRRSRGRPFNRAFAWRMRLADMIETVPARVAPVGLVFHLSRCGSTLVHRMLAATGMATALSEVPVFDAVLQSCLDWNLPDAVRLRVLRTVAAALANAGDGMPLLLKLDAWHILFWRQLRAAFPETPALFLSREPVEVLVSQRRQRGIQCVPEPKMAALCGISDYTMLSLDEYGARLLAAFCRQAAGAVSEGAMIAVDYRDLPEAVYDRVLAHFSLAPDTAALQRMRATAGEDAKEPYRSHQSDVAAKQAAADSALRELAERIVGESYRALEAADVRGG